MAKRFTRNIRSIKDIEKQPKNTNQQNDLLSDDKHVYVRNKDQYEQITGGVKEVNGKEPDEQGNIELAYKQYTDDKISSTEKKINNTINGIQASGENLIQNGNFENGFTGWNPDASASLVNNERTSGKAVRMKSSGIELMTTILVEPGRTYEFGYWYKTSSDFDGITQNTKMRLGGPDGGLVNSESYRGNTTEWKKAAKTTKIKSEDIYSLEISIKSEASKGWIDFSEVYLIDITRYNDINTKLKKIKQDIDEEAPDLSDYATKSELPIIEQGVIETKDQFTGDLNYFRTGNIVQIYGKITNNEVIKSGTNIQIAQIPEQMKVAIGSSQVCKGRANDIFTTNAYYYNDDDNPNMLTITYGISISDGGGTDIRENSDLYVNIMVGVLFDE